MSSNVLDRRFILDPEDLEEGPSSSVPVGLGSSNPDEAAEDVSNDGGTSLASEQVEKAADDSGMPDGMDLSGFAGPTEKVVKPLTPEALAAFKAAQDKAGVIYVSRIPPGMRPTKVRHLLGQHGEIGRVYLQQEDPKRAYLRRKHTSTKKVHFTEGWVEFRDKKIARAVAEMLNAQPIGGKKGTRWRDDIWTMKYLPRFKWNMLTEQIAHEAAIHRARLGVELSQSRVEQREYLKNVELARVLDKRAERKRLTEGKAKEDGGPIAAKPIQPPPKEKKRERDGTGQDRAAKKKLRREKPTPVGNTNARQDLSRVLGNIF